MNYGRGKGNELNLPSFEEGRVIARGFEIVSPNLEFPLLVHTSQIPSPAYNIYYVNFHGGRSVGRRWMRGQVAGYRVIRFRATNVIRATFTANCPKLSNHCVQTCSFAIRRYRIWITYERKIHCERKY